MNVDGKYLKITSQEVVQYIHYISFENKYMGFDNKEKTMVRSMRIGCTIRGNKSFLFGANGFHVTQLEDSSNSISEITIDTWKRMMIKVAIDSGYVNDKEFYVALNKLK
jgi:hypothetical protein